MNTHPVADLFPPLRESELLALAADIKANGLENWITLSQDGATLLDGRNRLRACELAGVEPEFEHLEEGKDEIAFIISQNLHRRHLDESQRAMVGAQIATMPQGARTDREHSANLRKVSQPEAAAMINVSVRSLQSAKAVLEKADPMVVEAVVDGRVAVSRAAEIAALPVEDQRELAQLPRADLEANHERLKKEHKRQETIERIRKSGGMAAWPSALFSVFYADPAWEDDFGHTKRDVEHHYPTMTLDEIKALDVRSIATPDAVLLMWAIPHMLHKALDVMAHWGFEYRTHLVWAKDQIGLGQWARNEHELLLIGRRGAFPPPPEALRVGSVIAAPVGAHSEKPAVFAELIEKWWPGVAKVELFQRGDTPRPGWAVWGNEARQAAE